MVKIVTVKTKACQDQKPGHERAAEAGEVFRQLQLCREFHPVSSPPWSRRSGRRPPWWWAGTAGSHEGGHQLIVRIAAANGVRTCQLLRRPSCPSAPLLPRAPAVTSARAAAESPPPSSSALSLPSLRPGVGRPGRESQGQQNCSS